MVPAEITQKATSKRNKRRTGRTGGERETVMSGGMGRGDEREAYMQLMASMAPTMLQNTKHIWLMPLGEFPGFHAIFSTMTDTGRASHVTVGMFTTSLYVSGGKGILPLGNGGGVRSRCSLSAPYCLNRPTMLTTLPLWRCGSSRAFTRKKCTAS